MYSTKKCSEAFSPFQPFEPFHKKSLSLQRAERASCRCNFSPFLAFQDSFTFNSLETFHFNIFIFFTLFIPFFAQTQVKSSCQNTFSRPRSLFEPSRVGHPVRKSINVKIEQVRAYRSNHQLKLVTTIHHFLITVLN